MKTPPLFGEKRQINSKRPTPTKKKGRKKKSNLGSKILQFFLIALIWGICLIGLGVLWFSYDLPDIKQLQSTSRKPSVTVLSQDGTTLATYGHLFEDFVRVQDLPPHVPGAIMAVEDRRFYSHFGLDVIGLVRAAVTNYKANRVVQGGSTLTQQLAKLFLQSQGLYTPQDRSLRRKVQEAIMALWLEWNFTKDQILTIYLNRVYLGSGAWGIDAASRKYFHKSAKELSVYEAAVIAGLLKAPSKYSPAQNPQKAKDRAITVLKAMEEAGTIQNSAFYLQQAEQQVANQEVPDSNVKFFTDWIDETLSDYVNVEDQDLIVVTTLDRDMQKAAEAACQKMMAEMGKDLKTTQVALVSMTPQGAVRALVGGIDYNKSQFNRAIHDRQTGSTFKVFVYLAALEEGMTPETMIEDTSIRIGNWEPSTFGWKSEGEISIRTGLARSVNPVTVRLAQAVGAEKIAKVARRLGITSNMAPNLSICLGSAEATLLDLSASFATFANKGREVWPFAILEIRNKQGKVLYQHKQEHGSQIISVEHTKQMHEMLRAVVQEGTGRAVSGIPDAAGKTGSNGNLDAWFVGYTPNLVTGVWTGNDHNEPMAKKSMGSRLPARTWAAYMRSILDNKAIDQTPPDDSSLEADEGWGEAVESTHTLDDLIDEAAL